MIAPLGDKKSFDAENVRVADRLRGEAKMRARRVMGRGMASFCVARTAIAGGGARKRHYAERKIFSEHWWWGKQKVLRGESGESGGLVAEKMIAPLWG